MQADQSAYLANMRRPVTLIAFGWKSYIGLEVQQLIDAGVLLLPCFSWGMSFIKECYVNKLKPRRYK
jgi:hypothetical protein